VSGERLRVSAVAPLLLQPLERTLSTTRARTHTHSSSSGGRVACTVTQRPQHPSMCQCVRKKKTNFSHPHIQVMGMMGSGARGAPGAAGGPAGALGDMPGFTGLPLSLFSLCLSSVSLSLSHTLVAQGLIH
jgi:hypothetical protein